MTILVFGGSSQIGYFLLPRLVKGIEPVVAVSRQRQVTCAGLTWVRGQLPDAVPEVSHVSAVLCCGPLLPLTTWLKQAMTRLRICRVIAISSMSVQSKQDSPVQAERDLAQQLCEGEAALAAVCATHHCAWTVLRPTLIYGVGMDKSLTLMACRAMHWRCFPLPAGSGLRQPVHAMDVAQAMLTALDCSSAINQVVPIGGGERLTAAQMFRRVRSSLPVRTIALPLPDWLLRGMCRVLPFWVGPLSRLEINLVADNTRLTHLLGIRPRPFLPDSSCWERPSIQPVSMSHTRLPEERN